MLTDPGLLTTLSPEDSKSFLAAQERRKAKHALWYARLNKISDRIANGDEQALVDYLPRYRREPVRPLFPDVHDFTPLCERSVFPDHAWWPDKPFAIEVEKEYRRGFLEATQDFLPVDSDCLLYRLNELGKLRADARVWTLAERKRGDQCRDIDKLRENANECTGGEISVNESIDVNQAMAQAFARGGHQAVAMALNAIELAQDEVGWFEDSPELATVFTDWINSVNRWHGESIDASDEFFAEPPCLPRHVARAFPIKVPAKVSSGTHIDQLNEVDVVLDYDPEPIAIERWGARELMREQTRLIPDGLPVKERFTEALSSARNNLVNAQELERVLWSQAASAGLRPNQLTKGERKTGGWSLEELSDEFVLRRPYLIDGLLRRGEIMNIIAAPKQGKSWLLYNLLMAGAVGGEWFGYNVPEMPILLIDNELHPEELSFRLSEVAKVMGVDFHKVKRNLVIEPLRGHRCDINEIERILSTEYKPSEFSLIAIDAFYRILPDKMSENDNGAMTQMYNQLDSIASHHDASIIQIHHASKGDQSQKAVTDVGAGAGAMTRATDTHITIRPHQINDCVVVDAVTRSSQQPESRTAQFAWPLWTVLEGVEPALKTPVSGADRKQESKDAAGINDIGRMFASSGNEWMTRAQIRTRVGMGPDRTNRLVFKMLEDNDLQTKIDPNRTRDQDVFRLPVGHRWTEQ